MSAPPAPGVFRHELPAWLWLWFPPLLLVVQFGCLALGRPVYDRLFDTELGVVELATPAVLIAGIAAGLAALRHRARLPAAWLAAWLACMTLGCVYFAGEEVSWGQHLVGWGTPETIAELNDQGETNLHNMSSWFDQKPRLLLELWVLAGGLVLPLVRRARGLHYDERDWRAWFWPTQVCVPAAALAILIKLPPRIQGLFDLGPLPVEIRWSEPQEYYFGVFLMLYLASAWVRLKTTRT